MKRAHRVRAALAAAFVAAPLATAAGARAPVAVEGTAASPGEYWVLLASDRDGTQRAYSVRPDGSGLSPLLPSSRPLRPAGATGDGRTIAFTDRREAIYVSRADGTGLHRLVRKGFIVGFSPNGKLLAFTGTTDDVIWIVGVDGRGRRRLTSIPESPDQQDAGPDWSPNGKAVVIATLIDEEHDRYGLFVQPLRGKRRVLARSGTAEESDGAGIDEPRWSPDGRWIAFVNGEDAARRNGIWVVRPDGRRLHRLEPGLVEGPDWSPDGRRLAYLTYDEGGEVRDLRIVDPTGTRRQRFAGANGDYAWSPDSTRMAFEDGSDLTVVGVDGQRLAQLSLGGLRVEWFTWSPDGRQLVLEASGAGDPEEIWVVGSDGSGLRRLTNEGENGLVGLTPLAPVLPPAAPLPTTESVLGADTVATRAPVAFLSADGATAAFIPQATTTDCDHVAVWTPGETSITRFNLRAPCGFGEVHVYDVQLAGSRVAWASYSSGLTVVKVKSPALDHPVAVGPSEQVGESRWPDELSDYHLRGDGDLLVYNDGSGLVRVDAGGETCGAGVSCAVLRRRSDGHACCPDSVSAGLIAVREAAAVAIADAQGKLVRVFPFAPADVSAARLDGTRLVVWRFGALEVYDAGTGARVLSRPMPPGYRLADVDGGIAVLTSTNTVKLLRVDDGRSLTLPGGEPTLADLEPPGLYYSSATGDGGGRVVFVPRSQLVRQLDGSAR